MTNLTTEDIQAIFLTALKDCLLSARRQTDKQIITRIGLANFEDAVNQTSDYLEAGCSLPLSKNEYLALMTTALKCLFEYLRKCQIPSTLSSIATHIHLLSFVMDNDFPGYASSGFLRSIIYPTRIEEEQSKIALRERAVIEV